MTESGPGARLALIWMWIVSMNQLPKVDHRSTPVHTVFPSLEKANQITPDSSKNSPAFGKD